MPSKDTIPFKITIDTKKELERIRNTVAKEKGLNPNAITWKVCEIILREKSQRGFITNKRIDEILMGKIR